MREEEWMFHIGTHAFVAEPFASMCVFCYYRKCSGAERVIQKRTWGGRWQSAFYWCSIDKCALKRFNIEIKAIRKIMFSFSNWLSLFSVFRRCMTVCEYVWVCECSRIFFFQGVAIQTATPYDYLKQFAFSFNAVVAVWQTSRDALQFSCWYRE